VTEQRLRERLHQRAEGAPDGPIDYGRIWDEAHSRRRRRNGWTGAIGGAAAVALVIGGGVALSNDSTDSPSPLGPPASSEGEPPDEAHSVLSMEMLDMRGRELAEALGLQDYPTNEGPGCTDQPGAEFVEYVNGRGYCVAVGNAPDNWLAFELVWNQWSLEERWLERAGVPWTAELPPPPPVVVDLLRARVAELAAQDAEGSTDWVMANLILDEAQERWAEQRSAWDASGWNDHYWGDPWWPTME
jgi:hypothetical protein